VTSRSPGPAGAILPVVYTLALFGISSIPGTSPDAGDGLARLLVWMPPAVQNVLHIPQYALLSWLWSRAGARTWITVALCGGYAVLEELHQTTVPGRYGSWTDLALDALGIAVGIAVFRRQARRATARARL
jgi:hypothetical protein